MKQMEKNNKSFEDIKHIDENGVEFWYARELMKVLEYNKWENFEKVIKKAKTACENTGMSVTDHFPDVRKMVQIGLGVEKKKKDYKLTRYACYIIIQNADSRKKAVALAKTYIVTQTMKRELSENYYKLAEDLFLMTLKQQHMTYTNKSLKKGECDYL